MKYFSTRNIVTLAASATLLLGAMVPVQAAATEATVVGSGGGVIFDAGINSDIGNGAVRTFSFNVALATDGTVSGHCNVTQAQGIRVRFDVTSYDIDASGALYFAGPVTSFYSPNPDVPDLVGFTATCAMQDNEAAPDSTVFFNVINPVQNGPNGPVPFTTLTEMYDFFESVLPPFVPYGPTMLFFTGVISPFAPLSAGNVSINENAPDPIPNA